MCVILLICLEVQNYFGIYAAASKLLSKYCLYLVGSNRV